MLFTIQNHHKYPSKTETKMLTGYFLVGFYCPYQVWNDESKHIFTK